MERLRGSGPWLASYIIRTLRELTADVSLSGHYLQVVSPVKDRHLRVTDGKHSMEAMLTVNAAVKIDADEDDIGVSLNTLCGHIIALPEVTVVPELSYCAPRAILVLRKVTVFPDRKLVPPAGSHPCVFTEENVMDAIRVNVGRSLAKLPSKTSGFDAIPNGFPPSGLQKRAIAYAKSTLISQAGQSDAPGPAPIVEESSDEQHSILDFSTKGDESGKATTHEKTNTKTTLNANTNAGRSVGIIPNPIIDELENRMPISQSPGQIQTQCEGQVETVQENSSPVIPVLTQRMPNTFEESGINLSQDVSQKDGISSEEVNLILSTEEESIKLVELPQTQHFAIDEETEDEPTDDDKNCDDIGTMQHDRSCKRNEENQFGYKASNTRRTIEDESHNDERVGLLRNLKAGTAMEESQLKPDFHIDEGGSGSGGVKADTVPRGNRCKDGDGRGSVSAHANTRTPSNIEAPTSIVVHSNTGALASIDAYEDICAGAGVDARTDANTNAGTSPDRDEGAKADKRTGTDRDLNEGAAANTIRDTTAVVGGILSSSTTVSPPNRNDAKGAIEIEQPERGIDETMEDEGREIGEEVFGAQLCDEVPNDVGQAKTVVAMPQVQLFKFADTDEEETDENELYGSCRNDVNQEPNSQVNEICAGENRTDLCISEKATSFGSKPSSVHRDSVGTDRENASDSDRYLVEESSGTNDHRKVAVLTQIPRKRRRVTSTLKHDPPPTKLAKASTARAARTEQSKGNELRFPATVEGTTDSEGDGEQKHGKRQFKKATRNNVNEGKRKTSDSGNKLPVRHLAGNDSKDTLPRERENELSGVDSRGVTSARRGEKVRKRERLGVIGAKCSGQSESRGPKSEQTKKEASSRGQNIMIVNDDCEIRLKRLLQHMVSPLTHSLPLTVRKPLATKKSGSTIASKTLSNANKRYPTTERNMSDRVHSSNEKNGLEESPKPTNQSGSEVMQQTEEREQEVRGVQQEPSPVPLTTNQRRGRRGRPPGRGARGGVTTRVTRSRDKGPETDQAVAIPVVDIDGDNIDNAMDKAAVVKPNSASVEGARDAVVDTAEKIMADTVGKAVGDAVEKVLEEAPSDGVINIDMDINLGTATKGDLVMKEAGKDAGETSGPKGVGGHGAKNVNDSLKVGVATLTDPKTRNSPDTEMTDLAQSDTVKAVVPDNEGSINVSRAGGNEGSKGDAMEQKTKLAVEKALGEVDADLEAIRRVKQARDKNPVAFLLMPEMFMESQKDAVPLAQETHTGVDTDMNIRAQAAAQVPDSAPL